MSRTSTELTQIHKEKGCVDKIFLGTFVREDLAKEISLLEREYNKNCHDFGKPRGSLGSE